MFSSRDDMYSKMIKEHDGVMALSDEIDAKEDYHPHHLIRIRRCNHKSGLYETEALAQWFEIKQTDPNTREDISFHGPRLRAKLKWLQMFPNVTFSNLKNKIVDMVHEFITDAHVSVIRERARAFCDIEAFDRAGLIHDAKTGFDMFKQKEERFPRNHTWLLRFSSKHNSPDLVKNSRVVVIMLASGFQYRICEMDGLGFAFYNGNKIEKPQDITNKLFPCFVDAVSWIINDQWNKIKI
ncbi:MAG: hypothetical protein ACYSUZ_06120 [Planctomycetota bacterium]|jgi:hypothetical protein